MYAFANTLDPRLSKLLKLVEQARTDLLRQGRFFDRRSRDISGLLEIMQALRTPQTGCPRLTRSGWDSGSLGAASRLRPLPS